MKLPFGSNRRCRRLVQAITLTLVAFGVNSSPLWPLTAASPQPPGPGELKGGQLLVEMAAHPRPVPRLPSDRDIPALSSLAEGWEVLARSTHFVNTVNRGVTARVAIHEVGAGPRVLVCIHGLLSQSTNWKYVAAALGGEYELWLIDLPGCGQSDAPDPGKLGPGGYGPTALAERVLQVLETRLAARTDVHRFLLAGHSLGGMVALRMFADDTLRQRYAGLLGRVDGLALFAPCDVVVTQFTPTQHAMLSLNGCRVFLGNLTGLLPGAVERSTVSSFTDPGLASRELKEQGVHLLKQSRQRHVIQAMLRDALPWRALGKELDWPAIEALERSYRNIRPPCLIVWGECDPTFPVATGYKMKDQIPDARLVVVQRAKHLLQLENPAICAQLVRQFDRQLRDGGLAAAHSVQALWPEAQGRPGELAIGPSSQEAPVGQLVQDAGRPGAATSPQKATLQP